MYTAVTIAAIAYWLRGGKDLSQMTTKEVLFKFSIPLICAAAAVGEDIRAVF